MTLRHACDRRMHRSTHASIAWYHHALIAKLYIVVLFMRLLLVVGYYFNRLTLISVLLRSYWHRKIELVASLFERTDFSITIVINFLDILNDAHLSFSLDNFPFIKIPTSKCNFCSIGLNLSIPKLVTSSFIDPYIGCYITE